MYSMHSTQPRPLGPRRPASPARPHVAPLNIRKVSNDASPAPNLLVPPVQSRSRSPTPTLGLHIPGVAPRPKPKLPTVNFDMLGSDNKFAVYSDGNSNAANPYPAPSTHEGPGEPTIMPNKLEITISPQPRRAPPISIGDIRQTVQEHDQWSDDMLEEVGMLGEGAGGAVHKVRDRRTGMIMARKTITTMEAPMKQLLREIKIISSTSHYNIIHFFGAYISPSSSEVKVLMEYCEGGSLESVGKRMRQIGGRVGEKVAGRLAEGILQGLAYLHTKRTIHRDIKPPNILLTYEGVVKLADFGVSGELVNSMAGTFTGTSLYMAPERLSGMDYTIRSDVWSTGISLLELVQNRFPFPNDLAAIELMMYITQNEPPELEDEEGIAWSAEMKDFIKVMLTRDPNQRPTPKEMLAHPWITSTMAQELSMAYWMRKVWGWPKRKPDDASRSRPGSSRSEPASLDMSMATLSLGADTDSPPKSDP